MLPALDSLLPAPPAEEEEQDQIYSNVSFNSIILMIQFGCSKFMAHLDSPISEGINQQTS